MINWFASLFFAAVGFGLAFMIGAELELSTNIWVPIGTLLWLAFGIMLTKSGKFAEDVSEPIPVPDEPPSTSAGQSEQNQPAEQSLHDAVVSLTQELRAKELAMEKVQARLTEREFRRSLSRLATIHETLAFTLSLLNQGKLTHADAVEQLRQEIEAAASDLGLEHHVIQAGSAISSLPLGSFVILRSEAAPSPALAGTVKEVMTTGLCARDEAGKAHFISPSKIHAYKL